MYPFSTQNRKDFYNLMDVYLDAAFFPVIDPIELQAGRPPARVRAGRGRGRAAGLQRRGPSTR